MLVTASIVFLWKNKKKRIGFGWPNVILSESKQKQAKARRLTIRNRTVRVMRCYCVLCLKAQILTIIRQAVTKTSKMEKEEHAMEFTENASADGIVDSVKKFLESGCKCSRGPKDGPGSSQFTGEVMANLNNCLELSTKELDLVILANIRAVTRFENIGE